MNTKKPILFFVLLLTLSLCFAATCNDGDDDDDNDDVIDDDDTEDDEDIADDDDDEDDDDDDNSYEPLVCDADVCTDPNSGLMWMKTDHCCEEADHVEGYCLNLDFAGYGDWRGPTVSELRSLIRGCPATEAGGDCGVTDLCLDSSCHSDACNGCANKEGPGPDGRYWPPELEGEKYEFWTSSEVAGNPFNDYWRISFGGGEVSQAPLDWTKGVRCVRTAGKG